MTHRSLKIIGVVQQLTSIMLHSKEPTSIYNAINRLIFHPNLYLTFQVSLTPEAEVLAKY